MKSKIIITLVSLITVTALARVLAPFKGWTALENESPYIVIARCGERTPPVPGVITINATKSDSAVEVVSVLKGAHDAVASRLLTDHDLQRDENYLIFGHCDGGICQAYEDYRVIPLGANFHTNTIADKTLDEQLQILFRRRVDNLSRQMKSEQEEMQRLEEGLK